MIHPYFKLAMMAALLCVLLFIVRVMFKRDKDPDSKINLDDLLLGDDGRLSKAAVVLLGSFLLTTWVIIHLTLTDKLTEAYLGAYMAAWVIPTVTKLIKG